MERPTSVTVFGILNVVFAALGMFGILMSLTIFSPEAENSKNPVIRILHEHPGYMSWLKASSWLGLASCAVSIISGIGLLMLKPWARVLGIGYSIYAIVMSLVGLVLNYIFVVGPLLQEAGQKSGPEAAGAIGGAIGGMIGGCLGVVYPVLLIYFMTRPKVMATFRSSAP